MKLTRKIELSEELKELIRLESLYTQSVNDDEDEFLSVKVRDIEALSGDDLDDLIESFGIEVKSHDGFYESYDAVPVTAVNDWIDNI